VERHLCIFIKAYWRYKYTYYGSFGVEPCESKEYFIEIISYCCSANTTINVTAAIFGVAAVLDYLPNCYSW
jgi:hypothetical protein